MIHIIHGPPGTGKTTYLAKQARRAIEQYGSDCLLIASLTKAAAHAIASRDLPIEKERVGTLHSICYRALGCPTIAESKAKEWNESGLAGAWQMSSEKPDMDDPELKDGLAGGDAAMAEYNIFRARCYDGKLPYHIADFAAAWEAWKKENDYMDFTDLIARCLTDTIAAPGAPRILIGDEAQDWSRLELKLFKDHWGSRAADVLLAGDYDQALYVWRGADPSIFLEEGPEIQHHELTQSYRVPAKPLELAKRWIRHPAIGERRDVEYRPTDKTGDVLRGGGTWKQPWLLMPYVQKKISAGESVMILTTCGYMTLPIVRHLRDVGLPFYNPYRRKDGRWNPIRRGRDHETTATDRILAFMRGPDWTAADIKKWIEPIRSEFFKRGKKTELSDLIDGPGLADQVSGALADSALALLVLVGSLAWYRSALLGTWEKRMEFPLRLAMAHGQAALTETPKIVVGTINSVKGGEADHVVLFPDLSAKGMQEWYRGPASQAPIIRQFYVGATRTRGDLILADPASRFYVAELWLNS